MSEVFHDVFGDGQAVFFVRRLRKGKAPASPKWIGSKQQKKFRQAGAW